MNNGSYFQHKDETRELYVWSPLSGVEIEVYDEALDKNNQGSYAVVIPKDRIPELITALQKAATRVY